MSAAELSACQNTTMEFDQIDAGSSSEKSGHTGAPNRSRSKACLHCRRRKMRCDGAKPSCFQCKRADRASECEYDDGTTKTVTQLLYEKLHRLEKRLRELQAQNPNRAGARGNSVTNRRAAAVRSTSRTAVENTRSYSESIASRPSSSAGSSSSQHAPSHNLDSFTAMPSIFMGQQESLDFVSSQGHFVSPSQFQDSLSIRAENQEALLGRGDISIPTPAYDMQHFDSQPYSDFSGYDSVSQGYNTMLHHDLLNAQSPEALPLPLAVGGDEPSPALSQYLIDCFVPHAQQVGYTPRVPFFAGPLPRALLYAIFLWGLHFAPDRSLQDFRELFLRRALTALPELLHQHSGCPVGNLLAAIQASTLLATYFFAQGRSIEGAYHANTASGLILCTGLHTTRLFPSRSHPSSPLSNSLAAKDLEDVSVSSASALNVLPSPRSRDESVERLCTFWNAFVMERTWAAACGLPTPGWRSSDSPSLLEGHISDRASSDGRTVISASWPEEYSVDNNRRSHSPPGKFTAAHQQNSPISSQSFQRSATVDDFLNGIDHNATNSPMQLRVKAAALFEAAARLSEEAPAISSINSCSYTPQLASLQRIISVFIKCLPPVRSANELGGTSNFDSCSLSSTHCMAQASVIRAHYALAERAYELCRQNGHLDVGNVIVRNETEERGLDGVFERLFAYEAVNSQFGMDVSQSQSSSHSSSQARQRMEVPTMSITDNAVVSMAGAALDKCVTAAKEIALIVEKVTQTDFAFLEPIVGSCWMLAALVLLREIARINDRQSSQGECRNASTNEFDEKFDLLAKLNSIIGALQCLGRVFPIVDNQAQKISSMLASQNQSTLI